MAWDAWLQESVSPKEFLLPRKAVTAGSSLIQSNRCSIWPYVPLSCFPSFESHPRSLDEICRVALQVRSLWNHS